MVEDGEEGDERLEVRDGGREVGMKSG